MQSLFYWIRCYAILVGLSASQVFAQTIPSWSYQSQTGPTHWAALSSENQFCGNGTQQSPIALNTKQVTHPAARDFTLDYQTGPTTVILLNAGRTLQANVAATKSIIVFKGKIYELMQFHFHTPGEHQLNGKRYPMELHLVHKDAANHLTVVGVFIEKGQKNKPLAAIFTDSSGKQVLRKPLATVPIQINLAQLLPRQQQALVYVGSLTTPPCSEHVNWIVLEQPIQMSAEQIATFKKLFPDNHRPLQKKNHRLISEEA